MEFVENYIPPEEERFADNTKGLSELTCNLVEQAYKDKYTTISPELVKIASCFIENMDKVVILESFVEYSHTFWDQIKERRREFFMENAGNIFKDLPVSNVSAFKMLFTTYKPDGSLIISDDSINSLWEFFDSLIKICIKYVHKKRKPFSRPSPTIPNTSEFLYHNRYMDQIDILAHAKKWSINLEFPPMTI